MHMDSPTILWGSLHAAGPHNRERVQELRANEAVEPRAAVLNWESRRNGSRIGTIWNRPSARTGLALLLLELWD